MSENTEREFVPFKSFFYGLNSIRSEFVSYDALINACEAIIDFYREMHEMNIFGGIDDDCIMINIETGALKIRRKDAGLSLKYRAPELIRGMSMRDNEASDNFTLAVILFRMFFIDHPFEGKIDYATAPFLSRKICEMLYGFEPVFVYAPDNDSNRPLPNLSPYLTSRWAEADESLRNAFTVTFTSGIENIGDRPSAEKWRDIISNTANELNGEINDE